MPLPSPITFENEVNIISYEDNDSITSFEAIGLNDRYIKTLPQHIKFPTPVQIKSIPAILRNAGDVLIESHTGTGKTLAFLLPLLQLLEKDFLLSNSKPNRSVVGTSILIIVPTRELAIQTNRIIQTITQRLSKPHWIVSTALFGQKSSLKDNDFGRKSEKARLRKGVTIVTGTPGRILDHCKKTTSWRGSFDFLVIDEADRLSDMGFLPQLCEIIDCVWKRFERRGRFILSSATLSNICAKNTMFKFFAGLPLENPFIIKTGCPKVFLTSYQEPQTHKYILTPTKMKLYALFKLLDSIKDAEGKTLVFASCCDVVDWLYTIFNTFSSPFKKILDSFKSIFQLHGNMPQTDRTRVLNFLQSSKTKALLFSTDVAARGIDLPEVTSIIHYDAPFDPSEYIHRAGRTNRFGNTDFNGASYLMLMPSEEKYIDHLKSEYNFSIEKYFISNCNFDDKYISFNNSYTEFQEKLLSWMKSKEGIRLNNKNSPDLQVVKQLDQIAKSAYSGFLRAYATHRIRDRDIFHIKRLHLGHLAESFGIPYINSETESNENKTKAKFSKNPKKNPPSTIFRTQSKSVCKILARQALKTPIISEFDAGI